MHVISIRVLVFDGVDVVQLVIPEEATPHASKFQDFSLVLCYRDSMANTYAKKIPEFFHVVLRWNIANHIEKV